MKRIAEVLTLFALLVEPVASQIAIVPGDRFRSWTSDEISLEDFRNFYVVTETEEQQDEEEQDDEEDREEDEMRLAIDSFIVDALLQLGLNASSGELEAMPAGTEVKVTYESLIQRSKRVIGVTDLVVFFRDASTNVVIGLVEMEKVQNLPGPEMITSAVHYIVNGSVELSESPYSVSELKKAYDAEMRDPEGEIPALSPRGQISVLIAQPSVRWPIIYPMRLVAKKEFVDYRQLLEVAKEALENQIRDAGGTVVAEGGDKTITLAVTDVANIAIIQTFLNFTVETGGGYVQGLQAYGKHWNYRRSMDSAVADVPVQVLNDPNVIAYLER